MRAAAEKTSVNFTYISGFLGDFLDFLTGGAEVCAEGREVAGSSSVSPASVAQQNH